MKERKTTKKKENRWNVTEIEKKEGNCIKRKKERKITKKKEQKTITGNRYGVKSRKKEISGKITEKGKKKE